MTSSLQTPESFPISLYNMSFSGLMPGPWCEKAGQATIGGKCVDMIQHSAAIQTAVVDSGSRCGYGHQYLPFPGAKPGEECVNRLMGPVAPYQGQQSINGQNVIFGNGPNVDIPRSCGH
jgi:hypothetical protein